MQLHPVPASRGNAMHTLNLTAMFIDGEDGQRLA